MPTGSRATRADRGNGPRILSREGDVSGPVRRTEAVQREEAGEELYRELLALVKDKSVVLEGILDPNGRSGSRAHPGNGADVDEACARLALLTQQ